MDNKRSVTAERIDDFIRFSLYVLVLILPFGKAWAAICSVTGITLLLIKRVYLKDFRILPNILNKPIAVYVIAGALSVAASVYFKISLHAFFSKFLEGILFLFIIGEVINKKRHVYIITVIMLAATAITCLDGLIQYYITGGYDLITRKIMIRDGITAAFNHPNDLAAYLLLGLLLSAGIIAGIINRLRNNNKAKIFNAWLFLLVSLFFIILATFLLTKSRGALIGAILGFSLLVFILYKKAFLAIIISGIVVLTALFIFVPRGNLEGLRLAPAEVREMAQNRTKVYRDVVDMIKARPFFGHGINTFMRCFEAYKKRTVWTGHMYAHNCYLQIAAETGIIGLISFLWVLLTLFYKSMISIGRHKQGLDFVMAGLLAALFAFLAHSLLDTNLYSVQLNTFFWVFIGLSVAVHRLKEGKS